MANEFDSKEYQFKDIQVVMAGRDIATLKEIKFGLKRDKEYNFSRGDQPHSIQHGNLEGSGSIKVTQGELDRLIEVSPKGDCTLLIFGILVAFAPELGTKQSAFALNGVELTEWELGMAQGDKMAEVDLPFMFLNLVKVA